MIAGWTVSVKHAALLLASPNKERRFIPRITHGGFRARLSVISSSKQRSSLKAWRCIAMF